MMFIHLYIHPAFTFNCTKLSINNTCIYITHTYIHIYIYICNKLLIKLVYGLIYTSPQ
ncbi:hypothetical protein Hanom_Chr10g00943211 [Helianthus anomalus]